MTQPKIEQFFLNEALKACESFREKLSVPDWLDMVKQTFIGCSKRMAEPLDVESLTASQNQLLILFNRPLTAADLSALKLVLPPVNAAGVAPIFNVGIALEEASEQLASEQPQ